MEIDQLLTQMVQQGGSDLHIKAGGIPRMRLSGKLVPIGERPLDVPTMMKMVGKLLDEKERRRLVENCDVDVLHVVPGVARFRCNLYKQNGGVAGALRVIPNEIPELEKLGHPKVLKEIAAFPRGLVLVTGTTGSGKSTTLAAMINHINETRADTVITIEDPVEFFHHDKKCLINQRTLGHDVPSFSHALKYVLRQDPDVILIGEMRDPETITTAITAAETGHLVFSTLHTTDAAQTVERIINAYPSDLHEQVRLQLSLNLKAVISQRLLPRANGQGRIAALEIMVSTPSIRKQILEGEIKKIYSTIQDGSIDGMQTFNQVLEGYVKDSLITKEAALLAASRRDELELSLKMAGL
jgi:twitching motility protein PilT